MTFLLTDVEGSTALWEEAPAAMRLALARHDEVFEQHIGEHGGTHIRPRGEGDSRFAVFASAAEAVAAALAIQHAFAVEPWPTPRPIRVRIGVHTGEAELRDGDYYGSAVNRCARLRGIGHGGQVLLSAAVVAIVAGGLPTGASLTDLGEHRLKDLTQPERVAQVTLPTLPSQFPPLSSLGTRPHNLPVQPTALLGRDRAVADVLTLFDGGARLVTLTGPGGTGKTRLSVQVAAELLEQAADGVWLVELAPISDPVLVPSTIAQVLGVREFGGRPALDVVREHLRGKSLLLVLDNFEQILSAASVVSDMLAASAGLRVLVSSREPLRLRGEVEYAVPPLALPDPSQAVTPVRLADSAAVSLFVERASAVRTGFAVTDRNAPAIAEICRRLDGLPLAIELAAARVRLLSPEAMVTRLDRRLPLLTGGARDLPARQQTLRNAIAWSHDLLTDDERTLFCRLAVFVGGWSLESAEAVCQFDDGGLDVLSGLDSLVSKSLVKADDDLGSEPRFRMLETIREFGLEQLAASGEEATVRRRHLRWCTDFAVQNESRIYGPGMVARMEQLRLEHDNFRAALAWSLADSASASADAGLWLAGALGTFWFMRDHIVEGVGWIEQLLVANPLPDGEPTGDGGSEPLVPISMEPPLRPNVYARHPRCVSLIILGMFSSILGNTLRSISSREEALVCARHFGDGLGAAQALVDLGQIARSNGDHAHAIELGERAMSLARDIGDLHGIWRIYGNFGDILLWAGDAGRARTMYEEGLRVARMMNGPWQIAQSLRRLGAFFRQQGDVDRAAALFEEAVERFAAIEVRRGRHWALRDLGRIAFDRGDLERAGRWFAESLTLCYAIDDRRTSIDCLEGAAATLLARDGEPSEARAAARILGSARTLREQIGFPISPSEQVELDRTEIRARSSVGDESFDRAFTAGAALPLDEAIDLAVTALGQRDARR